MRTPQGRVPGFGPDERPKRQRRWNTPWRDDPINSIPMPRGMPAMREDGTLDGTESEDIHA